MPSSTRTFVLFALVLLALIGGCANGSADDNATSQADATSDGGSSKPKHDAKVDGPAGTKHADGAASSDANGDDGNSNETEAGNEGGGGPEGSTAPDGAPGDAKATGDGGCATGATEACVTSCGTTGAATCSAGAFGACAPPAETCNLMDDDCDGFCDDVLGCRVGVDRSVDGSVGFHFYTTNDAESGCCGYTLEQHDAFYLYSAAQTGSVAYYRCSVAGGAHLYTTDPACEGNTVEGVMGYVATSAVCGAVPLYRLDDATSGDHLYTTSSAEATSAESMGYVANAEVVYVWPGECGGPSCTWPSPIALTGSMLTAATGFPTAWYGFPIDGTQSYTTLSGTVSVENSANIYSEVLFILQYLPSGACTSGLLPASTPEYGLPGTIGVGNIIVKAPTSGTFSVAVDWTLPGGLPITNCVLLGLNGGTVAASHDVTATASLALGFTSPQAPTESILGGGSEFCFGQNFGCEAATTDDTQSFATVTPFTGPMHLIALYGDISDSTFDGSSSFGAPPAGAWTATNDFYVYHGADCSSLGVTSGNAGPGNFYANIPADATHLLSVPLSGNGIGVAEAPVFQNLGNVAVTSSDCLVTLWGLEGGGAFDNETQVSALVGP